MVYAQRRRAMVEVRVAVARIRRMMVVAKQRVVNGVAYDLAEGGFAHATEC